MAYIAIEQNEMSLPQQICPLPQEVQKLADLARESAARSWGHFSEGNEESPLHLYCVSFVPPAVLMERIELHYNRCSGFHSRLFGEFAGEIFTIYPEGEVWGGSPRGSFGFIKSGRVVEPKRFEDIALALTEEFGKVMVEKAAVQSSLTTPTRITDLSRTLRYSAKVYLLDNLAVHFEYRCERTETRIQLLLLPMRGMMENIVTHYK